MSERPTAARLRRPESARTPASVRWFLDPYHASLFVLVLLTISRLHEAVSWIGRARPGVVLLAIALIAVLANPRGRLLPLTWTRRWQAKVVAALGVLAILGAPFGLSLGASVHYLVNYYLKVLLLAFLVMSAIRRTDDLAAFVWSVVLSCGILVWMSIFIFRLSVDDGVARLANLYTWDANELGSLLLLGLPLAVLVFRTSQGMVRSASGIIIAAIGVSIARSGSRGAFLGLAVIGLLFLLSLKHISVVKRAAFVGATVIALLFAAPPGYWNQMGTMVAPTKDYNWNAPLGRRELALHALGYAVRYPVFGLGISNFGRAEGTISSLAQDWRPGMPGVKWSVAHNSYLQAGAELGIPGLLLWTFLIVGCIAEPRRLRRRLPKDWAKGDWEQRFLYESGLFLSFAATGFAVTATFLSLTWQDPVYLLAALTLGYHMSVRRRLQLEASRVPKRGGSAGDVELARSQLSGVPNTAEAVSTSLPGRPTRTSPTRFA